MFFLTFTLLYVVTSNLSRSISKMKMEKRSSVRGGESNLRDAQPLVSQLHGFSGILHWFHRIPGLPVWTQACECHTEQHRQQQQLTDTHTQQLGRYSNNEFHFLSCTSRIFKQNIQHYIDRKHYLYSLETHTHTHIPGAQLSTSAPSALPLLQSRLKLVIGRSGTLCWIQPSRRCLGVLDSD